MKVREYSPPRAGGRRGRRKTGKKNVGNHGGFEPAVRDGGGGGGRVPGEDTPPRSPGIPGDSLLVRGPRSLTPLVFVCLCVGAA